MESLFFQIWSFKMSKMYLQGIEPSVNNFVLISIMMFRMGQHLAKRYPALQLEPAQLMTQ